MSSGLPVVWKAPSVISLRVASTLTPSPIWTGFEPPFVAVGAAAPWRICESESAKVMFEAL